MKPTDWARFLERVSHEDRGFRAGGPCWIWTGSQTRGYGTVRVAQRSLYAHRYAYQMCWGDIPNGLEIDHLCRQPLCTNPLHLEAVTPKENNRRGLRGVLKTHCANGHDWVTENIGTRKNNGGRTSRFCIVCKREKDRAGHTSVRSPYRGVSWHRSSWRGQFQVDGKHVYLGRFPTPEAARDAVAAARENFYVQERAA